MALNHTRFERITFRSGVERATVAIFALVIFRKNMFCVYVELTASGPSVRENSTYLSIYPS